MQYTYNYLHIIYDGWKHFFFFFTYIAMFLVSFWDERNVIEIDILMYLLFFSKPAF